jgi:putative transposase
MRESISMDENSMTQLLTIRNVHRGNLFYEVRDYHQCLYLMKTAMSQYGCYVHAYVLLPHYIYLLLTAPQGGSYANSVKFFEYKYAMYFNVTHRRIRHKLEPDCSSIPVVTARQVLSYCRYVELAAVRAGLADHPADYPWSSYGCNAMGEDTGLVSPHAQYLALGAVEADRRSRYRQLFESGWQATRTSQQLLQR